MIDQIFRSIENLISDFTWRRISVYFTICITLVGMLIIYELYTDSFKLSKLKSASEILVTLESLESYDSNNIQNISSNIIQELNRLTAINVSEVETESAENKSYIQAFFASLPWILMLAYYLVTESRSKSEDWEEGILGLTILAFFATLIGYGIDVSKSDWYRFGVPQIANLIMMLLFSLIGNDDNEDEHNKPLKNDAKSGAS